MNCSAIEIFGKRWVVSTNSSTSKYDWSTNKIKPLRQFGPFLVGLFEAIRQSCPTRVTQNVIRPTDTVASVPHNTWTDGTVCMFLCRSDSSSPSFSFGPCPCSTWGRTGTSRCRLPGGTGTASTSFSCRCRGIARWKGRGVSYYREGIGWGLKEKVSTQ